MGEECRRYTPSYIDMALGIYVYIEWNTSVNRYVYIGHYVYM